MSASTKRVAKVLGKQVAAHRGRLGLSRPELAARLDIDRTYIWRIEQGEAVPSLRLFARMADLFDVSLDELRRPSRAV